MRRIVTLELMIFVAALSGIGLNAASEQESWCGCSDIDIAGRISASFEKAPVPSGSFIFEIGAGLPAFSFSAWATLDTFPAPTSSFGGQLSLPRDWLVLGLALDSELTESHVEFVVKAGPPSWLVYNGTPALIAGLTADLRANLLGEDTATQVSAAPFLTVLTPVGDYLLSSTVGMDIQLDSARQLLQVPSSLFSLGLDLGSITVTSYLEFKGALASIASANVVVDVPDWGLALSGELIPAGSGAFFYQISVSFQWGDVYLLPSQSGQGGSACAGGVCY